MGLHTCELCDLELHLDEIDMEEVFLRWHSCERCDSFMAGGNFGVPSGGLLFVAPEMLPHYVQVHRYRPPDEFSAAVMQSPFPGTDEYRAAVEPFRLLHERYRKHQHERAIMHAARWAFEQGGSDETVSEAGLRFLSNRSPETCERIRRAIEESVVKE